MNADDMFLQAAIEARQKRLAAFRKRAAQINIEQEREQDIRDAMNDEHNA